MDLAQFAPLMEFAGDDAINAMVGPDGSKNLRSLSPLKVEKVAPHLYGLTRDNIITALIDPENDVIRLKRYDYMAAGILPGNDGVWLDPAEPNNGLQSLVHSSWKSQIINDFRDEVYDLKKYDMDLVEAEDKVYLPFQLLDSIAFRCVGYSHIYNGVDYYPTTALSSYPTLNASCYSNNNTFLFADAFYEPSNDLGEGELYRYVASVPKVDWTDPEKPEYDIFALLANGGGAAYSAFDPTAAIPEDIHHQITWERIDGDTYISLTSIDKTTKKATGSPSTMRVLSKGGFFNTKTRSQALTDFNYDLLRFQFDEFYGLKEELKAKQGYVDFDSFVAEKGLKEKFLSLDATVYDEALAEFTMKYIDDGHTSYGSRSIFSGVTEVSASALAKNYVGPRVTSLRERYSEYTTLRKEAVGEEEAQTGLFIEGETAVLRFDMFAHFFALIPPADASSRAMPIDKLFGISAPMAFLSAFDLIKEHGGIDNIVIDLTCNQGGAVLTIPFLAAFFTSDPTMLMRDVNMGVDREFHYAVDLNQNGIFGEKEDSHEGDYNFFVLTSDFSFSCGSLLPSVAHNCGVKIIGAQGGGGACPVGNYSDACGSNYNVSSPMQTLYRDAEGNLVNNDEGVPVDYPLAKDSWYDLVKLNQFVSNLSNQAE